MADPAVPETHDEMTSDNADQERQALDTPREAEAPADQGQTDSQSGNHSQQHGEHRYLGAHHLGENQARYQTIIDNDGRNVEGLDEAVHQRIIRYLVDRHPDFAQRYATLNPESAQPSATPAATTSTTPNTGFIGPLPPPKQDNQEAEVDFTYDGPHEEWPVQESVDQNSEAIFAVLHDQMMDLARKRVTNRALDGEANELALELLARAELPLYIRVRANIVLSGGGHESYLWYAHEALRCVNKGRTLFDNRSSQAERLASAGLHEEATEAVRRAERDHRQLQLIKKKLASGRYENKEGKVYRYGGNRSEGREDSEDEDEAEDDEDEEEDDEDEDDIVLDVEDDAAGEDAEQEPEWEGFPDEEDAAEDDAAEDSAAAPTRIADAGTAQGPGGDGGSQNAPAATAATAANGGNQSSVAPPPPRRS